MVTKIKLGYNNKKVSCPFAVFTARYCQLARYTPCQYVLMRGMCPLRTGCMPGTRLLAKTACGLHDALLPRHTVYEVQP